MKGIDYLSVVSGVLLVFAGVALLITSFFFPPAAIYGVVGLVLGIVILITLRKQEYIEPIKSKHIKGERGKK